MEMFLTVFSALFDPSNVLIIIGGTLLGIVFGAVPVCPLQRASP